MADPAAPGPVAAELAAIRERWSKVAYVGLRPEVVPEPGHQPEWLPDVPRLLAAVEAVLAMHKPTGIVGEVQLCDRHASYVYPVSPAVVADRRECPGCHVVERPRCWHGSCPDEWPCPDYAAISAALLGKDGTDE